MAGTLKGYQDTPEEIDKAAYEVFYNIIKELEEKFECRIICFNQVYVGGKKNEYIIYTYDRSIGGEVVYSSADGRKYKFPVVGRLKKSYFPIGNMFTEKVSCQVMDFRANKKTVYLLK